MGKYDRAIGTRVGAHIARYLFSRPNPSGWVREAIHMRLKAEGVKLTEDPPPEPSQLGFKVGERVTYVYSPRGNQRPRYLPGVVKDVHARKLTIWVVSDLTEGPAFVAKTAYPSRLLPRPKPSPCEGKPMAEEMKLEKLVQGD